MKCPKCSSEMAHKATWVLTDYKTWGSYRVAKVLGIVETGKQPDPSGAVYKSSGRWGKAGTSKMITTFTRMPQQAENWETELQLNRYRIMLEERGVSIGRMQIQITVRDGGLAVARSRGIERNTYMVSIKRLIDDMVIGYFKAKANALNAALKSGAWTEPCDNRECWDGNRCAQYCEVALYCTKGLLHQQGGD